MLFSCLPNSAHFDEKNVSSHGSSRMCTSLAVFTLALIHFFSFFLRGDPYALLCFVIFINMVYFYFCNMFMVRREEREKWCIKSGFAYEKGVAVAL